MTNKSQAKGTKFETDIAEIFDLIWPGTIRRGKQGANDKGDIYMPGNDRYVVECKNEIKLDLAGWRKEAEKEAENAGVPIGIVVHKRKGKGCACDQWVTMTVRDFLDLCG